MQSDAHDVDFDKQLSHTKARAVLVSDHVYIPFLHP